MPDFPVSPEKENALKARLQALGVREEDLEEKFVRSGGKGGQNVNKVATCVQLRHLPTGLFIKCQEERSQGLNRFLARRLLAERLEALRSSRISEEQKRIEKIRRQKRRRSRKAREKILRMKARLSEKKRSRTFMQRHWSE